ncbi:hypothetical protein F4802DRAFT_500653 [Xylaria palmicola]|nr:hypothetical protein F4802DRAFT_500653 [Xylaria palmicola]
MEGSASPPASSDSQARKRKSRNSDIRKEQNRIASRAYREKRRQKLALLDEILKSDCTTDAMSSVSDETDYNSTTSAPDFRAMESTTSRTARHASNSPAPYYLSAMPALAPAAAAPGLQPLPSNGPSHNTEAYISYAAKDYEGLATHAGYSSDPGISTMGMSSGYVSPLSAAAPMPSTPMFPFDDEFMGGGDAFGSAYPQPDGTGFADASVSASASASGCDPNMINALQSLSRLSDSQQQQIVAFIQKRRTAALHPAAAAPDHAFHHHLGYGPYQHVPVPPRSSPGSSGHIRGNEGILQDDDKGFQGRYTPKSHR